MKNVTAHCITTISFGKRMFVLDSTARELDQKELVELTDIKEKSKPFRSSEEAEAFIGNIHNPFERAYMVDTFEVPAKAFIRNPQQGTLI